MIGRYVLYNNHDNIIYRDDNLENVEICLAERVSVGLADYDTHYIVDSVTDDLV